MLNELLLKLLKNNCDKFFTSQVLIQAMKHYNFKLDQLTIRNLIRELRISGEPIVATNSGYCWTTDKKLLKKYINDRTHEIQLELNVLNKMRLGGQR